jgi:hypothetical protein
MSEKTGIGRWLILAMAAGLLAALGVAAAAPAGSATSQELAPVSCAERPQPGRGTYFDAQGLRHGFVLDRGVYRTVDAPGAVQTAIADINNRGQILGTSLDGQGAFRSFVLTRGVVTTIEDVPGASSPRPSASTTAAT